MMLKRAAIMTRHIGMWSVLLFVVGLPGCAAFPSGATPTTTSAQQTPHGPRRGDVKTFFPQITGSVYLSGLAVGPDGNLWVGESGSLDAKSAKIAKFSLTGQLTEYPVPNAAAITYVIAGPDGNMWFDGSISRTQGFVGRVTPDGHVTEFLLPHTGDFPYPAMAVGADGNIWFVIWRGSTTQAQNSYIERITPQGKITEFTPPTCSDSLNQHMIWGMVAGPDGNIWFDMFTGSLQCGSQVLDEITPKGTFSNIAILEENGSHFSVREMAQGPNNTVWINEGGRIVCIGCLAAPRIPTAFSMPKPGQSVGGLDLVAGPDSTMWFAGGDNGSGFVGQITSSGTITTYPLQGIGAPQESILGPDKALWFIDTGGKQLVRFQILG